MSHTYHKHVTNVSPTCFYHPTVWNFEVFPYYKLHRKKKVYPRRANIAYFLYRLCILPLIDVYILGSTIVHDHQVSPSIYRHGTRTDARTID